MKTRTIALTMALCFIAAAVCLASDAQMGTWKLNEAKSTFPPGATKNQTVVYQAVGDDIKVTIDGTSGSGTPLHIEWTGKFDGKFYSLTGDPNNDERSYKPLMGIHFTQVTTICCGKAYFNVQPELPFRAQPESSGYPSGRI